MCLRTQLKFESWTSGVHDAGLNVNIFLMGKSGLESPLKRQSRRTHRTPVSVQLSLQCPDTQGSGGSARVSQETEVLPGVFF